jgi:hypothetical protein
MFMLPYAAFVAAAGVDWLWQRRGGLARGFALVLVIAMPLQFAVFYRDFFTHYALRSAFYYDPAAAEDVAEYMMADTTAPLLYFSEEIDDIGAKWRYYTTRDGRTDLLARTRYVTNDGLDIGPSEPGSLLAVSNKVQQLHDLEASGLWKIEKVITDVDQRPTVVILRKLR